MATMRKKFCQSHSVEYNSEATFKKIKNFVSQESNQRLFLFFKDLWCVYKRRVGIKREEFNKPFSHHLYLLFGKGFCKVQIARSGVEVSANRFSAVGE